MIQGHGLESSGSVGEHLTGSHEHGNGPSGFMKSEELPDYKKLLASQERL
jgi:hypothetical protein